VNKQNTYTFACRPAGASLVFVRASQGTLAGEMLNVIFDGCFCAQL
jgi:hypothetical protein